MFLSGQGSAAQWCVCVFWRLENGTRIQGGPRWKHNFIALYPKTSGGNYYQKKSSVNLGEGEYIRGGGWDYSLTSYGRGPNEVIRFNGVAEIDLRLDKFEVLLFLCHLLWIPKI